MIDFNSLIIPDKYIYIVQRDDMLVAAFSDEDTAEDFRRTLAHHGLFQVTEVPLDSFVEVDNE